MNDTGRADYHARQAALLAERTRKPVDAPESVPEPNPEPKRRKTTQKDHPTTNGGPR